MDKAIEHGRAHQFAPLTVVLLDAGGAKMLGPTAGRLPQCLAAGLSVLTFFELRLLKAHQERGHAMMSRSMIVGMLLIVAIEVLDLLWQMN